MARKRPALNGLRLIFCAVALRLARNGCQEGKPLIHETLPKRLKSEKPGKGELVILAKEAVSAGYAACNAIDLTGIHISPGLHDQSISVEFLSDTYGGSRHATFSVISDGERKDKRHSFKAFFCPDPTWNPYIPQRHGACGLFFSIRDQSRSTPTPLIVRLAPHQWQYMGHHTSEMADPLTKEEWGALSQEVCTSSYHQSGFRG